MLTNNVDICDRLINGQLGTVARILVNEVTENYPVLCILSLTMKMRVI